MNSSVVLSTAYLPPIQYVTKFILYNTVWMEQHENYMKQTYRNRCLILGSNGPLTLSIPIVKQHNEKIPIRNVLIDYSLSWQKIHWKAIESAYGKSPFFLYYKDDMLPFFTKKYETLFEYNFEIITAISKILGLSKEMRLTSEFQKTYEHADDLRHRIHPKPGALQDLDFKTIEYYQTFGNKFSFAAGLSILDLLFNEGNESISILKKSISKLK